MKSISLKLADALDQQLETVAQEQKTTKSGLVREALEIYLTGRPENRSGFSLALAGDLVGCVDGPEDLSTDRRYLDGFGA